ncbi:hypothetical protein [Methanothermococcus sp.]|uniref:hypothetical protein n=1 Tax=Methanothermococcus sp. TaxID=2614238 RepID=UPI0025CF96A0|nr:hypothetical protein [Methanothermococcus sp.]
MIFDSDLLIAVIIIIVGMGFFTSSMIEHTNNYEDTVKTNIMYDKVVYQLKSLISDGTIETAILLINNNNSAIAVSILKNRIGFKNYELKIGNYAISQGNLTGSKTIMASTTILMNRTEGWYGVYGNDNGLYLTNKHFISENETYNYLNNHYDNTTYPYRKAIYYFNSSNPINITIICGD